MRSCVRSVQNTQYFQMTRKVVELTNAVKLKWYLNLVPVKNAKTTAFFQKTKGHASQTTAQTLKKQCYDQECAKSVQITKLSQKIKRSASQTTAARIQ